MNKSGARSGLGRQKLRGVLSQGGDARKQRGAAQLQPRDYGYTLTISRIYCSEKIYSALRSTICKKSANSSTSFCFRQLTTHRSPHFGADLFRTWDMTFLSVTSSARSRTCSTSTVNETQCCSRYQIIFCNFHSLTSPALVWVLSDVHVSLQTDEEEGAQCTVGHGVFHPLLGVQSRIAQPLGW